MIAHQVEAALPPNQITAQNPINYAAKVRYCCVSAKSGLDFKGLSDARSRRGEARNVAFRAFARVRSTCPRLQPKMNGKWRTRTPSSGKPSRITASSKSWAAGGWVNPSGAIENGALACEQFKNRVEADSDFSYFLFLNTIRLSRCRNWKPVESTTCDTH